MSTAAPLEMDDADFRTVDIDQLFDIETLIINPEQSKDDRIISFIWQTHNPYCYRAGTMAIKSSYIETEQTLEDIVAGMALRDNYYINQ